MDEEEVSEEGSETSVSDSDSEDSDEGILVPDEDNTASHTEMMSRGCSLSVVVPRESAGKLCN